MSGSGVKDRIYVSLKKKFFNVYLYLGGGLCRETGRHRIPSRLQAPSHQHRARCGLELMSS